MRACAVRGLAAALLLGLIAVTAAAGPAAAQDPSPRALQLQLVGNFDRPQYVENAPGAANGGLLFVVEDQGTIRVVDHGHVLPDPFLDISGRVEDTGEQGLLSVAFAPDYATTRDRFYVYFTNSRRQQPDQRVQGLADGARPTRSRGARRRVIVSSATPAPRTTTAGSCNSVPDGML